MADTVTLEASSLALKAAGLATAICVTKLVLVNFMQAAAGVAAGARPPEDSAMLAQAGMGTQDGFKPPQDVKDSAKKAKRDAAWEWKRRVDRIQANDIENVPVGLVIIWAGVLCSQFPDLHAKLALGFAAARVGHGLTYALKISFLRSITFTVGMGCMMTMLYGIVNA